MGLIKSMHFDIQLEWNFRILLKTKKEEKFIFIPKSNLKTYRVCNLKKMHSNKYAHKVLIWEMVK